MHKNVVPRMIFMWLEEKEWENGGQLECNGFNILQKKKRIQGASYHRVTETQICLIKQTVFKHLVRQHESNWTKTHYLSAMTSTDKWRRTKTALPHSWDYYYWCHKARMVLVLLVILVVLYEATFILSTT